MKTIFKKKYETPAIIEESDSYPPYPCPHSRPSWRMCPHCNGLNSIPASENVIATYKLTYTIAKDK